MQYNETFWNKYADENELRYHEEFSKYVRDLANSLPGVQSVLEIGCGTGIDLRLFSDSFQLFGIDLNEHALKIAKEKLSSVNFQKGDITKLPFEDSTMDFVFTHGLMNYLEDDILEKGLQRCLEYLKNGLCIVKNMKKLKNKLMKIINFAIWEKNGLTIK